MVDSITSALSYVNKTVWMIDNNQRGHPLKFESFGSSNNFVKFTGRTSKQCIVCEKNLGEEDIKHSILTYVDQSINNHDFPVLENEVLDITNIEKIHRCLIRGNLTCGSTTKIDITGHRVGIYITLNNITSTFKNTIIPLFTRYNSATQNIRHGETNPLSISMKNDAP